MFRLLAGFLAMMVLAGSGASAQDRPSVDRSVQRRAEAARDLLMTNPEGALRDAVALRRDVERQNAGSANHALDLATADWIQAAALISLNRLGAADRIIRRSSAAVRAIAPGSALDGELSLVQGNAALLQGQVQPALLDYQNAFTTFRLSRNARGQAVSLLHIAAMYLEARDYQSVLKYVSQATELYSSDPTLLLSAYNNRAVAFFHLGRYRDAEVEYRRAFDIAKTIGSTLFQTQTIWNLAQDQAAAGDLTRAEESLAQGFALGRTGPAARWQPALLSEAADLALRRHDLDRAAALITRAFAEAKAVQAEALMPMRDFHETAYRIFRERGDDAAALTHLEQFKRLDDESRAVAASTAAALMAARFDFANQNLKIAQRDATISRAQARFRTWLTTGLLGAASLISTLLAIGFVSIRRSRNQVAAANDSLRASNAALEKALAAKTEFLATTSHEIRTPLNGILGMTQVILADRTLPGALRTRLELVQGSGETMRALVDDILDVAKMETGELRLHPAEMDLPRLLDQAAQVWAGQAETKRIALETDIAAAPAGIVADEVRLRQIVFNLMANAIKFTDRGRVLLRAGVATGDAGERLVIAVEDTGIGIPADRLEDVFESFRQVDGATTRRHGGTGLGLAICRSLARAMGGDVRVASTLGVGSTFTLDVPLVRAAAPPARPAATRAAGDSLDAARMLVIEGNPLSQGILRALLGAHVAALQVESEPAVAAETIAAGGADHVLADGATLGLDVAAAGRLAAAAEAAGAHFTLLWPAPSEETRSALAAAGVEQALSKPITAPDLLAALRMIYVGADAGREIAA